MSYSISRPTSKKYARQLLRNWNHNVHQPVTYDDGTVVTEWCSLQIDFPSSLYWLTLGLVGFESTIEDPKDENLHLAILSLVCREMLKSDHTNAKVLLTMVDDACSLFFKYLAYDKLMYEVDESTRALACSSVITPTTPSSVKDFILSSRSLQDWNKPDRFGTIRSTMFTLLRVWVSAFQSFIEMTDYRYEIWGFEAYNLFSSEFVL
jgi:hypothetical protein